MKKTISILVFMVLIANIFSVAFASNYEKLNELEKQIFNALLIMLEDFEEPSAIRIREMGDYMNLDPYRDPNNELFDLLAGPDRVTLTLTGGNSTDTYYTLFLTDWEDPANGAKAKSEIETCKSQGLPLAFCAMNFLDYSRIGYYFSLTKNESQATNFDEIDTKLADFKNINEALDEYWGNTHHKQEVCEHDFWSLGCIGINTFCPECQSSAELSETKNCPSCLGKGTVKCRYCNGKGRKNCSYCSGTGRRGGSECNYCGGKRALGCIDCLSSGYQYCSSCMGVGKEIILSDNCLNCGSKPQCCKYYSFHSYECPICAKDAYEEFQFKNVVRNSEQYIGSSYQVSGVVESVSKNEDNDTYELRIKHTHFLTKEYYSILYHKLDSNPMLLVGDKATLYGVFTGVNNDLEPILLSVYAELN